MARRAESIAAATTEEQGCRATVHALPVDEFVAMFLTLSLAVAEFLLLLVEFLP